MTRVLFVDDEADVLAGLRDMLRRQRGLWEMVFVSSGRAGLGAAEIALATVREDIPARVRSRQQQR